MHVEAAFPGDEPGRLETLSKDDLLEPVPEVTGDDIVRLAAHLCDAPMAALFLRDGERLRAAAGIGFGTPDRSGQASFYTQTILTPHDLTVVPDARNDARFRDNPLVSGGPRIRFYAAVPLLASDGAVFGILCVAGAVPRDLSPVQQELLRALARQLVTVWELRRRQAALERANLFLTRQSVTDSLTGLANRRAFEARLNAEVGRAKRYGGALSLLMIDVDAFKHHNDAFGHPAGDRVLQRIAALLTRSVRRTDVVARYGGEEFAIIVPEGKLLSALHLAERCRRTVEGARWPQRRVTVSVGAATLDPGRWDGRTLVEAADRALYKAKRRGRNRVASTPDITVGSGS